ncbi:MAG: hypothetical protein ABIL58_07100 [Pseudomonadota bacterium]
MDDSDCFKNCPICSRCWPTREAFLADPDLSYLGYQVHFKALTTGLFFFNHKCKTTLALEVRQFQDLYDGPVFSERKTGTDECPGHCLHRDNLEPCPAQCECAFVRELIQIIASWPKASGPAR